MNPSKKTFIQGSLFWKILIIGFLLSVVASLAFFFFLPDILTLENWKRILTIYAITSTYSAIGVLLVIPQIPHALDYQAKKKGCSSSISRLIFKTFTFLSLVGIIILAWLHSYTLITTLGDEPKEYSGSCEVYTSRYSTGPDALTLDNKKDILVDKSTGEALKGDRIRLKTYKCNKEIHIFYIDNINAFGNGTILH
jgi:hypothetical protein